MLSQHMYTTPERNDPEIDSPEKIFDKKISSTYQPKHLWSTKLELDWQNPQTFVKTVLVK